MYPMVKISCVYSERLVAFRCRKHKVMRQMPSTRGYLACMSLVFFGDAKKI